MKIENHLNFNYSRDIPDIPMRFGLIHFDWL